jgi:hypothetical protein
MGDLLIASRRQACRTESAIGTDTSLGDPENPVTFCHCRRAVFATAMPAGSSRWLTADSHDQRFLDGVACMS